MIRSSLITTAFAALLYAICTPAATAQGSSDYCQYATRTIVFLFDRTSKFDDKDEEALEHSLSAIDQYLDGRTYFSLQTIGEDVIAGRTILEKCIPACPPSSLTDVFVGSTCIPARANAERADFKRRFYHELHELTEKQVATSKSDIAARIVDISRTLNSPKRPITQLIIFSDLIDNVLVPHREIYTRAADVTMRIAQKKQIVADLKDANVVVFGFGRSDIPPRGALPPNEMKNLRDFWTQWFKASGAKDVSLGFRLKPPN